MKNKLLTIFLILAFFTSFSCVSKVDFNTDFNQKVEFQNQIKNLFQSRKFSKLDKIANKIRSKKLRFIGGEWKLEYFYFGLRDAYNDLDTLKMMDQETYFYTWIKEQPKSVAARIALADFYKEVAWRFRGTSYSNLVSDPNASRFKDNLNKILKVFEEAKSLSEKDPHLYAVMITVKNELGAPKSEIYNILNEGLVLERDYFPLFQRMATVLLPRWQGEAGEVEQFALDIFEENKDRHGYIFYALIADKARSYVGWTDYLQTSFSWDKIKTGLDEYLVLYPNSFYFKNVRAQFACIYKDYKIGGKLMNSIGKQWNGDALKVWKDKKYFTNNMTNMNIQYINSLNKK